MIKGKLRKIYLVVQKALINVLLFIVYIVGFGITKIFVSIFNKSLYAEKTEKTKSFWITSKGYEADINESKMES